MTPKPLFRKTPSEHNMYYQTQGGRAREERISGVVFSILGFQIESNAAIGRVGQTSLER